MPGDDSMTPSSASGFAEEKNKGEDEMKKEIGFRIVDISCGSSHSLAVFRTAQGDITASWGRGEDGQLGHGDAEERLRPQAIFGLINRSVSGVHCGAEYSVAVSRENKMIYSWGWGDFGRLGHGDCKDAFVPTPISTLSGKVVVSLACGDTHTLLATSCGALYSFGRNQNGQLGHGTTSDDLEPRQVEALSEKRVTKVACGAEHSVCCTDDGEVYAWGWGRYGNIGDGETEDRHVPTKVKAPATLKAAVVACAWRHSCCIDNEGHLWTWGWSKYGQLGHGDQCDQVTPKKVESLSDRKVVLIAGGWRHTMATNDLGQLYAWGWNKFGQLGLGHNEDVSSPQIVEALRNLSVAHLAAGWKHTLAVTEDGRFWGWGRGVNGQLGTGDASDVNEPKEIKVAFSELTEEAHPVVMYSVPPSDRYAIVPDNAMDEQIDKAHAVPDAEPMEPKRQKTS